MERNEENQVERAVKERKSLGRRVFLSFDRSDESTMALVELINSRSDKEEVIVVDVTQHEVSDPWGKLPQIVSPEGTFWGIKGIRGYINRPEESRRK